MKLSDRQTIYQKIEDYRRRPLIVYATSTRPGAPGLMASDAVREFLDQISELSDHRNSSVDVLLHSNGGDALVAWKLMSTLRQHFSEITVIVPYMAMSAATIFALGADRIYMHKNASLGPIDPQITVTLPDGSQRHFAYEDVGAFLRFMAEELSVAKEKHVTALISKLFKEVDPISVGAAKRASELSASIGKRLLLMHMDGQDADGQADKIASDLNKSFFAHGDTVSRKRAMDLNLKIVDEDPRLEDLSWGAYAALEDYMMMRQRYHPLHEFLKDEEAARSIAPLRPLEIPPNAPRELVSGIMNAALQVAVDRMNNLGKEVEYSLVQAVIESTRRASEYRNVGKIAAHRLPDGNIHISATEHTGGWRPTEDR